MSNQITVNSTKLTITKLSRLQKNILLEISPIHGNITSSLAHDVALIYHSRKRPETIKQDNFDISFFKEHGGLTAAERIKSDPNRTLGEAGEQILADKFKATYYRSIKRLRHRGLITKRRGSIYDDIVRVTRWYSVWYLTDLGKQAVNQLKEAGSE